MRTTNKLQINIQTKQYTQRRRKKVWDGGKTTGVWGWESLAGSRGGALVGGLGDEVPQKLKNFKRLG